MEEERKVHATETARDKATTDIATIEKYKASIEEEKQQAHLQVRRSLELSASFFEKLAALSAGSIALAVSAGVSLLGKVPHSASLHSNLNWLLAVASFLWLTLICAFGHNVMFIQVARLEAESAVDWSKWMGLINASMMQSATGAGDSKTAEALNTHIADTLHDRIHKSAMNLTRTEQTILHAKALGYFAIGTFLIAYTLIFFCIIRIWWVTR